MCRALPSALSCNMLFGVLGPVAVWTTRGESVPVPGLKVRALLAVLLVHHGRPVTAARLLDCLWGEDLPGDPAGTLSAKVSQLRRALETAHPGGRRLITSPPPGYSLRINAEAVDAHRFRLLTAQARETSDARLKAGLLSDALALWRGPAFADFADEAFAAPAAARLMEERLTAQEDHAEARLALGEHIDLIPSLAELLAAHPLRERLRAAHMHALYRAGRPSEALDSYEQLRVRLAEELGLDPGPDLVRMQRAVLSQDALLDPQAIRPVTNLPADLSELIGRDNAVAEIRKILETNRLVTLTGPGGVGKTRLALETARHLVDGFDDGVWLAELASLERGSAGEPADVVMAALDVRDVTGEGQTAGARLADALGARKLLLILDNCEHVVEKVAALAGQLLRAAPGLRILATSREPLGMPAEVVWSVPPLEVPDVTADRAEVAGSSAVRLFMARASAASPGFRLGPDTVHPVAVLCRRLDGIPLALELAATRIRAFGAQELVLRLDDRFQLLAAGRRDAPARQQTLTAMIDWSWELLTEPERIVLRRLAVHADGCQLEAAEQVSAEGGLDVTAALARLVDRSLVTVVHDNDGPRYRLLESVAAYCADRLAEAGESKAIRERHDVYYTALAIRAEEHFYGPDQREWLRRLDVETANIRSAIDGATGRGDAELALRLVGALTWYWFLRGRLAEARRSLSAALQVDGQASAELRARAAAWHAGIALLLGEAPDPGVESLWGQLDDPVARGRAAWLLAYAENDLGDVPAVDRRLERALADFRCAEDRWGTAAVLSIRAKLAYVRGDLKALERDGEESAALFRELGDRWGLTQATAWLGGLAETTGDHVKATQLHREGLGMAEELGLWSEVSMRLAWLGWIAVQQGDYPQAQDLSGQALRLASEQGFRVGRIFAKIGLGFAARRQGDLDSAERLLHELASAGQRQEGKPPPLHLPLVLTELGFLAEQRAQLAEAEQLHLSAFNASRVLGQQRPGALALEGLAGVVEGRGEHDMAAHLLGAADAMRRSASVPAALSELREIDRIAAAAQNELGDHEFRAAYQRGAGLTPEDAVALLSARQPDHTL